MAEDYTQLSQNQRPDHNSILYNGWFFDPLEKCKTNKTAAFNVMS